jgi:hypothetical protein
MATYLEGGVDFIPPVIPFQPNYNLILSTLQYRQGQYDQGFAQLKSSASSIINAQLLNETNIEKRKQIMANAESALKSLPTVDLSLPQNVAAAKNVFRPFYEDNDILLDMKETKSYMNERSKGLALRDSDKEEERKRYWSYGIQDLDDWADEFKKATPDQMKTMRSRRYVGKPMVGEKVLDMFKDGKLKREIDTITGQVKITDTNGKEVVTPLTNLYLSMAQNDPEAMEAFNVYGRVKRNQYIRDNESRFGSRDAAATEHDRLLVADFKASNNADLAETTEALNMVNARIAKWKERGVENLTDEEAQKFARDLNAVKGLEQSKKYYEDADQTAESNIKGNPTGYLGNVYLSKSARELAKSLSAFGSRKVDTNPVYKDLIHPFKLEEFKTNESMRLESHKSELEKAEIKLRAEMKELYGDGKDGDGDGSDKGKPGSGPGRSELNMPIVQDSPSGAGVQNRDQNKIPDAYADNLDKKKLVVAQTVDAKLQYIDTVLSASEMVDEKGKMLDQNQKQNLRRDGALLDRLVKVADKKVNLAMETKTDPNRFEMGRMKKRVDNTMTVWRAQDAWTRGINSQIVGNLEGSRKEDGWVFKHLMKDGIMVGDAKSFVNNVKQDAQFKAELNKRLQAGANQGASERMVAVPTPGGVAMMRQSVPASNPQQIEQKLLQEYTDKFGYYRGEVIKSFNTSNKGGGYSFTAQYDPMAANGGGGIAARELQFTGRSSVSGEDADVLSQDFLTKINGGEGNEDVIYAAGPDSSEGKAVDTKGNVTQDPVVKKLMLEVLKPQVLASIKAGKDSPMKFYTFSSKMVASNNPDYHVYTFTFDPDFLKGGAGTDEKPSLFTPDEVKLLKGGVSIYVKKDLDNSLASKRSTIGEVEVLVNQNPNGVFEDSVAKGYDIRIEKMIQGGGYKIITTMPVYSPEYPNGKPTTKTTIVSADTDLSYAYYNAISRMSQLHEQIETSQETFNKTNPDRKRYTMAEIEAMAEQQRQGF